MNRRIDWMEMICNALPDYAVKHIWTDGDGEILVKIEDEANIIADLIEALYEGQGEEIIVNTGCYGVEEDKRNNEEDWRTGWYYVTIG